MGAPGFCAPPPEPKAAAKKAARHSKIHTSQGLRDRRVRLSIGIAREFFDLQDMLGFDKASKTLDWLLSKSKKAIKELAKAKHDESPPAASSTCHVATTTQMDSTGSNNHSGEVNHVNQITRARARSGRTRKKICCGNPTLTNQSALTRASTSSTSGQVNLPSQSSSGPSNKNKNQDNIYYFPSLALDWDDNVGYNPVLPPSSFAISNLNLTGIGLGAQREHTHADN